VALAADLLAQLDALATIKVLAAVARVVHLILVA
jgi:hypothetical protein